MKKNILMGLMLLIMLSGCAKSVLVEQGNYDYLHFVRDGGGQKDFVVYPTENSDQVKIVVSKYQFRDTTVQIILNKSSDNADAFSALHKALNNQVRINGDFKQSTLLTGTWVRMYMVVNPKETEVTNTDLRNSLLQFEQIIQSKM